MILFAEVQKVRNRVRIASHPPSISRAVDLKVDEVVCVLVRKGVDQDSIDRAEDYRGGADAQREGEDGQQREAAILVEAADGVAEVLPNPTQESFQRSPPRSRLGAHYTLRQTRVRAES